MRDREELVQAKLEELNNMSLLREALGEDNNRDLNLLITSLAYAYRDAKLELDALAFLDELGWLPETLRCPHAVGFATDVAGVF